MVSRKYTAGLVIKYRRMPGSKNQYRTSNIVSVELPKQGVNKYVWRSYGAAS